MYRENQLSRLVTLFAYMKILCHEVFGVWVGLKNWCEAQMDKSRELQSNLETKAKRSNIIRRPIQKLFPLETSRVNTKLEETDTKCSMKFSEQKPDVVRRVKRDAAVLGELKRRYVDN